MYALGADPWGRSPLPPLDVCWRNNRDARPIKSRFYQSQNKPQLAFLAKQNRTIVWERAQPQTPSSVGVVRGCGDTPSPHPTTSAPKSIIAPTALDLTRAFGARPRPHAPPFAP